MSLHVIFAGVGEAFDERLDNCSLLVRSDAAMILLDCGFSAPFAFWRHALDAGLNPSDLDAVWVSHLHGDHFLGLPALLLRLYEEGRTRPLTIVGPEGLTDAVATAASLAYSTVGELVRTGAPYAVQVMEVEPGGSLDLLDLCWRFAAPGHSGSALSLRLDGPEASLFYSGDGRPTDVTRALAHGCGLIVHEAYALDADTPGHGTVAGAMDFARAAGASALALVHVHRDVRHHCRADMDAMIAAFTRQPGGPLILFPEPGDAMDVPPVSIPRPSIPKVR